MQHTEHLHRTEFTALSLNEWLKRIDASMFRDSITSSQKEDYVEEDEFSPAGIWDIGGRILYGFQHGDVVKANIGTSEDVPCVISNVSQDGFIVHSTQWNSMKNGWQFQNKTITLGDIKSFIGYSFSKEAAIKNASRFHR